MSLEAWKVQQIEKSDVVIFTVQTYYYDRAVTTFQAEFFCENRNRCPLKLISLRYILILQLLNANI